VGLSGVPPDRSCVRPAKERPWRHLDTCHRQTYLHARLPRAQRSLQQRSTRKLPTLALLAALVFEDERCLIGPDRVD
jgi:transposase IS204/IS1001/IS1096/IS1165 family protein